MLRTGGLLSTKFGIILLCFVGSICQAHEESRCTVPYYSRMGTCLGFDKCEELKKYFFPLGTVQLSREAREELDYHTRTCGFKGRLPLICCPNKSVSRAPASKYDDIQFYDEYDSNESFERGTAGDSRGDAFDKNPGRGSSVGQKNHQAVGRRNITGDIRPGNRVSKIRPEPVTEHKNFHLLPSNCGRAESRDRISNGNKTGILEFPWMALIAYNTKSGLRFACAGTIIHEFYILTAAHCVTNLDQDTIAGLRVGEHDISTEKDCERLGTFESCAPPYQDFVPVEIIVHPRYGGGKGKNGARSKLQHDIALVRLDLPIDLNQDNAKPICLPTTPELQQVNLDDKKLLVAGWGVTEKKIISFDLLKATLPVVPNDACHKIYSRSQTDGISVRQMCAGGVGGVDSCGGDSGGPLKLETRMGKKFVFVQHGIVSYGPSKCGSLGWPGVYTRLAYYMDWILDHMKP